MNSTELFQHQLRKGREGEDAFRIMANNHFDEVNDYTNYEMWKDIQGKGIDFGFKMNSWQTEKTCDVKTNLFYHFRRQPKTRCHFWTPKGSKKIHDFTEPPPILSHDAANPKT